MINANNSWEIIERAYEALGGNNDDAANPNDLTDYDYSSATEETAYEITGARFPEIAQLEAFARQGYLDNDRIWEEIGEAIARGLQAYAEERWQEYQDEIEEEEGEE
jgi:hypothetical protein